MKRLLAALFVVLACSSADAYWFWPMPNPELAGWYATYTTVQNGQVVLNITPANKGAAVIALRNIISPLPAYVHLPQPGVGPARFPPIPPSQIGPREEAENLLFLLTGSHQL